MTQKMKMSKNYIIEFVIYLALVKNKLKHN